MLTNVGKYEIVEVLGRGAYGLYYLGFDPSFGRKVEILSVSLDREDVIVPSNESLKRIKESFQDLSQLQLQGFVALLDLEIVGRYLYLVTEHIEGISLDRCSRDCGGLPNEHSLSYLSQIGTAIDLAHSKGVVLEDLNPESIVICSDHKVYLKSLIGVILKTLVNREDAIRFKSVWERSYVSPQRLAGKEIDRFSNLFSFSVIAYELLVGKLPFAGKDQSEIFRSISLLNFKPPAEVNPHLPMSLNPVFSRAFTEVEAHRYNSASDFCQEISEALSIPIADFKELGVIAADWRASQTETVLEPNKSSPRVMLVTPVRETRSAWLGISLGCFGGLILSVFLLLPMVTPLLKHEPISAMIYDEPSVSSDGLAAPRKILRYLAGQNPGKGSIGTLKERELIGVLRGSASNEKRVAEAIVRIVSIEDLGISDDISLLVAATSPRVRLLAIKGLVSRARELRPGALSGALSDSDITVRRAAFEAIKFSANSAERVHGELALAANMWWRSI